MSIKKKTVLATIVALVLLMAGLDASIWILVRHTFDGIEQSEACESARRGSLIIGNTLKAMDSKIYDWAVWDDAYKFSQDGNQDFIDSNLGAETMAGIGFNYMLFYNKDGKLIRAECVDIEKAKYVPMPEDLRLAIAKGTTLLQNKSPQDSVQGIILTKMGPLLIAKKPITHSDGKEPVGGTIIAGKYLNNKMLSMLSEQYAVSIDAKPIHDVSNPADYQEAHKQLADTKQKEAFIPISETKISAYTTLNDVNGKPALLIRMDSPRVIYAQSKVMMLYTTVGIVIVGILFGVFNILWLNKTVIKPVLRLDNYVKTAMRELGLSQ